MHLGLHFKEAPLSVFACSLATARLLVSRSSTLSDPRPKYPESDNGH